MVVMAIMATRKLKEKERMENAQGEQRGNGVQPPQAASANPRTKRSPSPAATKVAINYGSYSVSSASSEPTLQTPIRGGEDVRLKMGRMRGGMKTSLKSDGKKLSLSGNLVTPSGETGGIGTIEERIPLLDRPSSPESLGTMTGGFGDLPDSGLWSRDISGRDISKVLILLIFLLFSCAVVSAHHMYMSMYYIIPKQHVHAYRD